ncbi:MAG: hypothetical protein JXB39_10215 [Deltaproteobacteria bacterium]|nr:hypothetical protein [Deltaproteobacteria bacterium]
MSRMVLPLVLVLAACGPKEAPVQPVVEAGPQVPDDASSRRFGEKLVALEVINWSPTDGGAVQFVYNTLSFLRDNTWRADANVSILDEEVACMETGTWAMDPAQSDNTAAVDMTVDKTSCPGREAGTRLRIEATILPDGSYKFMVH